MTPLLNKHAPRNPASLLRRRAFTLLEVSVTIIIIAMLTGLALHMANRAIRASRRTAERQVLVALKKSITGFQNEFGFLPPLVKDTAPIVGNQPNVYGLDAAGQAYLQGFDSPLPGANVINPDLRYSVNSLTYYLMGLCNFGTPLIDGAPGSQFTTPKADGSFTRRGKAYDSFYDASNQVRRIGQGNPTITFNDRWNNPIRYYRWEPRPAEVGAGLVGELTGPLLARLPPCPAGGVAVAGSGASGSVGVTAAATLGAVVAHGAAG